MPFISPMLAAPMPAGFAPKAGEYIAEEKFDGHRLILEVSRASRDDLFGEGNAVRAWGRYGIARVLPKHIIDAAARLPTGVYDGELFVPGKRSYGVTELVNSPDLVYTAFDILELADEDTTDLSYTYRRRLLEKACSLLEGSAVRLSQIWQVDGTIAVQELFAEVLKRDGEGLIVKNVAARYHVGKRPKHVWIKMKALRSAVLKVLGYEPGKLGLYARVVLQDAEGNTTTVKTKNNDWLAKLAEDPASYKGRRLRIEFQERTPDGNYRHPRWDRWEDE